MDFSGFFDGVIDKAKETIKEEPGDYTENGLLYCGKCRTPKQGSYIFPWGEVKPPILCKCATERRDKEEKEKQEAKKAEYINQLRKEGFPQAEMAGWKFDADDKVNARLTTIMTRYVEHFAEMRAKGKGLLLFGDVGAGKTFYAACIANALIDQGIPCLMTDFSRLIHTIGGMIAGKQEFIDGLNRYALLVIDDLATEADTEYRNEIVYNVINGRYGAGLPVIVTTNLTADAIKNPADIRKSRIYSRLLEMCIPVEVKGGDRRKAKLKDDFKEYKDLLGL